MLHRDCVLCLNSNWKPIATMSPQEAFVAMCRERLAHYSKGMKRPYNALQIEYPLLPNGNVNFEAPCTKIPVEWRIWRYLPVRPFDNYIKTASCDIRIPSVIIANNYQKVPKKYPRFSSSAVFTRDNGECQYSGQKLNSNTRTIDHYIPRSKGGDTSFENCVSAHKDINRLKADLTPSEFEKKYGYKLKSIPRTPELKEFNKINNTLGIRDWDLFL